MIEADAETGTFPARLFRPVAQCQHCTTSVPDGGNHLALALHLIGCPSLPQEARATFVEQASTAASSHADLSSHYRAGRACLHCAEVMRDPDNELKLALHAGSCARTPAATKRALGAFASTGRSAWAAKGRWPASSASTAANHRVPGSVTGHNAATRAVGHHETGAAANGDGHDLHPEALAAAFIIRYGAVACTVANS